MKRALLCLYWLPLFPLLVAATPDVPDSLSLDQAAGLTLEHNPELKAAGFEIRAAAARVRGAELAPAYNTTLELEDFGGSGIASGTDNMVTTLSLSRVLETGDKAGLRGEVARSEAMLLQSEQNTLRLDVLAKTAKRFIAVVQAQQRLAISEESLALAQHTQQVVQRRVKAGRVADAELRRADISLARKHLQHGRSQREFDTACRKLAMLWGDTRAGFSTVQASLFELETIPRFDALERRLQHNPELVRFATLERLASTRRTLAQSKGEPDIDVSAGLRHYNTTDDLGLVVSLNIPLGSRSRASSGVEAAQLEQQREPLALEQRRLELHATLFEVYQAMQQAADAVRTLRETIIPQAELALADYESGYAAGRYSYLELTEAQRALLDARREAVDNAADYHRYRIEIDRLTGTGHLAPYPPPTGAES
jgi:cobalt-zinc-cadmium efflux system outer membrane protein